MKQVIAILLMAVVLLSGVHTAHAAQTANATSAPLAQSASPAHFNADAATEAYIAQLSPDARAKSDAYFEGGYWITLWGFLWTLGIAWLLLGSGLSLRMRDFAERLTRFRWLQTVIYAVQYILLTTLLALPLSIYTDFFREHQYGLSNQNFMQWFGDQGKSLIVSLIIGAVLLTIIYAVIRKAPRTWWAWGAGVMVVAVIFLGTLAPVYVAPLFNTYKPLPDSQLKTEILSMARANGIPATDVYEFDESRQSKRISANVSGMFGTTRISLNDNLLNRSTPAQVKGVLGHEMGHYVLDHIYKSTVFFAVIIFIGFAFTYLVFGWAQRRWGARWGLRGADDVAALPLLVAILTVFIFVTLPVRNTITRTDEAEADIFGLNTSRQPDAFAQTDVQLSEYRKLRPGPVEEFMFFDHPSGWNRIHRAMVWKGEHLNDADVMVGDATAPAGARAK